MQISKQLSGIKPSYIREILAATQEPNMLSLAGGLPASELLPVAQLMQAMESLASSPEVFQYGETSGYKPLLNFLSIKHQLPSDNAAMICTGSQQAIDLIARAYLNPGDTVAMEAPSYLGALQVFGLAQANIHSIEQTNHGPDLNQLEAAFASGTIKLFYGVPDFHNPTGVCWSLEVRKAVATLCNRYKVAFIEDVPYRELRFTGTALPLVSSFCQDNAFVMRSFSKVSSPGLRLGMVSAPKEWLSALVKVKQASDLHTGLPMQAVLLSLLQSDDFPIHLEKVRVNYKQRYHALLHALEPLLGVHCEVDQVQGGMFIWLKLLNARAMDVTQALMQKNVAVVPGDVFYNHVDDIQPALRLNFTHSTLPQIETAVARLSEVLNAQV
ncbi:MAG: DNA-binding transcriptional MocR family regulator [Arenicella sp.]|jgi:DNA-binding transcriptional MocR family regulator